MKGYLSKHSWLNIAALLPCFQGSINMQIQNAPKKLSSRFILDDCHSELNQAYNFYIHKQHYETWNIIQIYFSTYFGSLPISESYLKWERNRLLKPTFINTKWKYMEQINE